MRYAGGAGASLWVTSTGETLSCLFCRTPHMIPHQLSLSIAAVVRKLSDQAFPGVKVSNPGTCCVGFAPLALTSLRFLWVLVLGGLLVSVHHRQRMKRILTGLSGCEGELVRALCTARVLLETGRRAFRPHPSFLRVNRCYWRQSVI